MTEETIADIVYFLRKGNFESLQRAQLLLSCELVKQWNEHESGKIFDVPLFKENK